MFGLPHGFGNFKNESRSYEGQWNVGFQHGIAEEKNENSECLISIGKWNKGLKSGLFLCSYDEDSSDKSYFVKEYYVNGIYDEEKTEASTYDGSHDKEGRKSGRGKLQYLISGDLYDGDWLLDKRHGQGTEIYHFFDRYGNLISKSTYVGQFVNDDYEGEGIFTGADGWKYQGQWLAGKKHGKGIHSSPNGFSYYTGEWENDKRHGHGLRVYKDGERYEGNFENDQKSGKGIYWFLNNDIYEGEWKNNKQNGQGQLKSTKSQYYGEWLDNKKHGQGTFFHQTTGTTYNGNWENDVKSGFGILVSTLGNKYEGNWLNNLPHGKGSLITKSGATFIGEWSQSKWIKGAYITRLGNEKLIGTWNESECIENKCTKGTCNIELWEKQAESSFLPFTKKTYVEKKIGTYRGRFVRGLGEASGIIVLTDIQRTYGSTPTSIVRPITTNNSNNHNNNNHNNNNDDEHIFFEEELKRKEIKTSETKKSVDLIVNKDTNQVNNDKLNISKREKLDPFENRIIQEESLLAQASKPLIDINSVKQEGFFFANKSTDINQDDLNLIPIESNKKSTIFDSNEPYQPQQQRKKKFEEIITKEEIEELENEIDQPTQTIVTEEIEEIEVKTITAKLQAKKSAVIIPQIDEENLLNVNITLPSTKIDDSLLEFLEKEKNKNAQDLTTTNFDISAYIATNLQESQESKGLFD
eukprot:TRINITY_DN1675_c1_g5_i2.p1 TRINITY_DN1675_c1_g5~~TRINITY_DN1675_c1_g5_i2.p1  ORF type:complete len:695 (+),score=277.41 TRINITY_DN1675_c1_g5_i2:64-2148(+)